MVDREERDERVRRCVCVGEAGLSKQGTRGNK